MNTINITLKCVLITLHSVLFLTLPTKFFLYVLIDVAIAAIYAYLLYRNIRLEKSFASVFYLFLLLLFNPFYHLKLEEEHWKIINMSVAAMFTAELLVYLVMKIGTKFRTK